jgi:hypothetical protein
MDLCKYKNIFGEQKTGIHSYRFLNIAIVDVIFTIFGGFIISKIFNISFFNTTILLFLLGIILHRLFCVNTTIDKILFN